MREYDELYDEPSEFEQQIEEFKQSLLDAVKSEYKQEMEALRKENAELQSIKKDWIGINKTYNEKCKKLELKEEQLKKEAKSMRLSELLGDITNVSLYRVTQESIKKPKCNKCNRNREIEYTTPSGKIAYESCTCANDNVIFKPELYYLCEFSMRDSYNNKISLWYKKYRDTDAYDHSSFVENIYNGENYDTLKQYNTFFRSQEDCQKYCDYLNSKCKEVQNA